jgi:hypothetical protein
MAKKISELDAYGDVPPPDAVVPMVVPGEPDTVKVPLSLALQSLGGDATPPTELYVNASTGNDGNAGSSGSPLATIDEALRRVGAVRASCVIEVDQAAVSAFSLSELGRARPWANGCTLTIRGDASLTTSSDTGTVSSSTFQGVAKTGGGLTVSAHRGKVLRVTSGAQSGQRRRIVANDAAGFTLMSGFAANLAGGVSYVVEQPAVKVTMGGFCYGGPDQYSYLELENIEIQDPFLTLYGYVKFAGVTVAADSGRWWDWYEGGPLVDTANGSSELGFGWLGSDPGTLNFSGCPTGYIAGFLGKVYANNCAGPVHNGQFRVLGGALKLEAAAGTSLAIQSPGDMQSQRAVVYVDDFSGDYACLIAGMSFVEVFSPLSIGGSSVHAGRLMLREQSHVELAHAVESATADLAHASQLRIASGDNGGFTDIVIDGEANSTGAAIGFNAVGDSVRGPFNSQVYRTN